MIIPVNLPDLVISYQNDPNSDSSELFEFCIEFCYEHIRYHNYNMIKEDQEDFVQNILLTIFKYINTYDKNKAAFTTWLGTIINHSYYSYYKQIKNKPDIISYEITDSEKNEINCLDYIASVRSAEDEYFDQYISCEIYDSLSMLRNEYKNAIMMKDLFGFSSKTIAKYLHTTETNINVWRIRGKEKLKKILETKKILI